MEIHLIIRNSK